MKTPLGGLAELLAGMFAGALCLSLAHPVLAGTKFPMGQDGSLTLGAGVRASYTATDNADRTGADPRDFELESLRLYSSMQVAPGIGFELNGDYARAPGTDNFQVIDAIVKLEPNQAFNLWAGRMLPPTDRANFSGPYFQNSGDFPFVQAYPARIDGRDDGLTYWGQWKEGAVKWYGGAFRGSHDQANADNHLRYSARLAVNLWDPEGGYYNSSTYYGEKNILAFGVGAMRQKDGAGSGHKGTPGATRGDFFGWSADFLMERKLEQGVFTLEGAYYNADRDGVGNASNEGDGYFATVSWLFPGDLGPAWLPTKLQPLVRYQRFDPDLRGFDPHDRWDVGLNLIFKGHNARLSLIMSHDTDDSGPGDASQNIFKVGLQLQI